MRVGGSGRDEEPESLGCDSGGERIEMVLVVMVVVMRACRRFVTVRVGTSVG